MPDPTNERTDPAEPDPMHEAELLQLLSFDVGAQAYAVPILAVQEINRPMPIQPMPQGPASLEGVINLRGQAIPVVDLRKRFSQSPSDNPRDQRIIIVELQTQSDAYLIGFTVDQVNRVLHITSDTVDPAPATSNDPATGCVAGVGHVDEGALHILALDQLFSDSELKQIGHASAAPTLVAA